MKNLLLCLFALCTVILTSCSDKKGDTPLHELPTSPIENVVVPPSSADSPIESGSTVTIGGTGFNSDDEIWFRESTSKAISDIKAKNIIITESGISFSAPTISGGVQIILKRGDKEYILCTIYFSTAATPVKSRILGTGWDADDNLCMYELNPTTGEQTKLCMLSVDDFSDFVYLPAAKNIYGISWIKNGEHPICVYDTENNTFRVLATIPDIRSLIIINDELHAVTQSEAGVVTLYKINRATGEKSQSYQFNSLKTLLKLNEEVSYGAGIYDKATNSLIISVYNKFRVVILAKIDLANLTASSADQTVSSNATFILKAGDEIVAIDLMKISQGVNETHLHKVNATTGKRSDKISTLDDYWSFWTYSVDRGKLYGLFENDKSGNWTSKFSSIDMISKELTIIKDASTALEIISIL